jgi:hypothetical protein
MSLKAGTIQFSHDSDNNVVTTELAVILTESDTMYEVLINNPVNDLPLELWVFKNQFKEQ